MESAGRVFLVRLVAVVAVPYLGAMLKVEMAQGRPLELVELHLTCPLGLPGGKKVVRLYYQGDKHTLAAIAGSGQGLGRAFRIE